MTNFYEYLKYLAINNDALMSPPQPPLTPEQLSIFERFVEHILHTSMAYHPIVIAETDDEDSEYFTLMFRNKDLIKTALGLKSESTFDTYEIDPAHHWDVELPEYFDIDEVRKETDFSQLIENRLLEKFATFTNCPYYDPELTHCSKCKYADDRIDCTCDSDDNSDSNCCDVADCGIHHTIELLYECELCNDFSFYVNGVGNCSSCTKQCTVCDSTILNNGFCVVCYSYECTNTAHDDIHLCNGCTPTCDDCQTLLTSTEIDFCPHCMVYDCGIEHANDLLLCTDCIFPHDFNSLQLNDGIDEYLYSLIEIGDTYHVFVPNANHVHILRYMILDGEFLDDSSYLYIYDNDRWIRLATTERAIMRSTMMCGC